MYPARINIVIILKNQRHVFWNASRRGLGNNLPRPVLLERATCGNHIFTSPHSPPPSQPRGQVPPTGLSLVGKPHPLSIGWLRLPLTAVANEWIWFVRGLTFRLGNGNDLFSNVSARFIRILPAACHYLSLDTYHSLRCFTISYALFITLVCKITHFSIYLITNWRIT